MREQKGQRAAVPISGDECKHSCGGEEIGVSSGELATAIMPGGVEPGGEFELAAGSTISSDSEELASAGKVQYSVRDVLILASGCNEAVVNNRQSWAPMQHWVTCGALCSARVYRCLDAHTISYA